MSIFVPEYTVLAIVLLIFGYHALKELPSDDGAEKKEAEKHQRTNENADKQRIGKTA
jgi:Sec-independent protein translocase protein TatA